MELRTWCSGCGRERTIPSSAGVYPCSCGSSNLQSWDPNESQGFPAVLRDAYANLPPTDFLCDPT